MEKVPIVAISRKPKKGRVDAVFVVVAIYILASIITSFAIIGFLSSRWLAKKQDPMDATINQLSTQPQVVNVPTDIVPKGYPIASSPFVLVDKPYDPGLIGRLVLPSKSGDPLKFAEAVTSTTGLADTQSVSALSGDPRCSHDVGLVVMDPEVIGSDNLLMFGRTCGDWIDLTAAGQPQFGQTSVYGRRKRIFTELALTSLALPVPDIPKIRSICGATDVALGSLSGSGCNVTLSYRLLSTATGRQIMRPISVTGSLVQIDYALPKIASQIDRRLFISDPIVPSSTGLTPDQMISLGSVMSKTDISYKDYSGLYDLSKHSGLACEELLQTPAADDQFILEQTVQKELELTPNNAMAISSIALTHSPSLRPYASLLYALFKKYPGSALLANVEATTQTVWGSRSGELDAVHRAVADSPGDASNWVLASSAYLDVACDLRRGVFVDDIPDGQLPVLNRLYEEADRCAERATQIDPMCGAAWNQLSQCAETLGNETTARFAYDQAVKLDPSPEEVDLWGLQFFQPKWADDSAELQNVAIRAASRKYRWSNDVVSTYQQLVCVRQALGDSDYQALADTMLQRNIMQFRKWVQQHPDDPWANWGLAAVLSQGTTMSNQREATLYYRRAIVRLPNSASLHFELSKVYKKRSMLSEQETELRRTIALNPCSEAAHLALAILIESQGKYADAIKEVNFAIDLSPSDPRAYYALATMYSNQNDASSAIVQYQKTVEFEPYDNEALENMSGAYHDLGKYTESLATGKQALHVEQINAIENTLETASTLSDMEDDELHMKNWAQCLAYCNRAFTISPGYPLAEENVAEAYWGEGQKAKAIAQWKMVVRAGDPWSVHYARAFLKKYNSSAVD
jgi:tetratricopeptide (TPR) repeat protein